jgi:hypothetical protein
MGFDGTRRSGATSGARAFHDVLAAERAHCLLIVTTSNPSPPPVPDDRGLEELSRDLADAAATLEGVRASIHVRLRGVLWFGDEALRVREDWESAVGPALSEVAGALRGLSLTILEDSAREPHSERGSNTGFP